MVKHYTVALKGFYDVERTIGCGGFAKVKLATHLATGEKVAIKIMEKNLLKDDLPRVRVELKALKSLSHQHICKLYQVLETDMHFYIMMQYCSGGELFDHIVEKNRLTETESRTFFRQIISAVAYLHNKGYAHRDLKPENVLLDSAQQLKLIDFGLCARPAGGVHKSALYTSCGSPTYAAPELVLGKQYMGAQVDVWAMGVLLYALLSGHLPFDDQNIDRLYRKILSGKYDEPHYLSLQSRRLIRAMLQVEPNQRITVDQLCIHPWITAGGLSPINYKQQEQSMIGVTGSQQSADDEDVVQLMASYHGATSQDIRRHLSRGTYDYEMATYLLLMDRRKRGMPIGIIAGAAMRLPIRIKSADSIKCTSTTMQMRRTTRSFSKITRQQLDILNLPPPSDILPPPFSPSGNMSIPVTPTTTNKRNGDNQLQQKLEFVTETAVATQKSQEVDKDDKGVHESTKVNSPKPPQIPVQCNTPRRWVEQNKIVDQLISPAPAIPSRVLRNRTLLDTPNNRTPNGTATLRKPMKRIRSPNLSGECSPVPNKKSTPATPATPTTQTSDMNKVSHSGVDNGGSARKMLESIERSINRVKNVLTPRKASEAPSHPAILNNKNLSNVSTTQCTDPEFVIEELAKALRKKGIHCNRKGFTLRGKMDPPSDLLTAPVTANSSSAARSGCSFELEICYLPQMGLLSATPKANGNSTSHTPKRRSGGGDGGGGGIVARLRSSNGGNVVTSPVRTRIATRRSAGDGQNQVVAPTLVGIRRKRLKGDSWCYKKVCEQVLALTATEFKQVRESMV